MRRRGGQVELVPAVYFRQAEERLRLATRRNLHVGAALLVAGCLIVIAVAVSLWLGGPDFAGTSRCQPVTAAGVTRCA